MVFYHKIRNLRKIRDQLTVFRFLQCIVEDHDHRRKYGNTADHAEDNTFCHDDTKVKTQGKTHKAQRDKSGNRCDRASDYGFDRSCDCLCHRLFMILFAFFSLFLIAVPQEDRVVHRNTQLKDCTQRFRDVGNLSHENITSHVIDDRHTDTQQEKYRDQIRFHRQCQNDTGEDNRDQYIDRNLGLCQVLGVGNDS